MQGFWSYDNAKTLEVVIESSRVVDNELGPSVKGSPQYYHRWGHWHQWHLKIMRKYYRTIGVSFARPWNEPTLLKWKRWANVGCVFVYVCLVF